MIHRFISGDEIPDVVVDTSWNSYPSSCLIKTYYAIYRPFLEYVQPKADGQVPCEEGIDDGYISSRLSCLAIENNIYIGANFGTVVPGCEYCNHGGECYYNTNVVFSSNGSIVGVYHKYNLWTTELTKYDIDSSPQPQLVTVDTEFGVLGLSVCEDLLWKSPTVDLVTEKGRDLKSLGNGNFDPKKTFNF